MKSSQLQDPECLDGVEPRAAGTHRDGPIVDQLITVVIIAWYTIRRSCYRFCAIGTLLRTPWMGQHCRIIMCLWIQRYMITPGLRGDLVKARVALMPELLFRKNDPSPRGSTCIVVPVME